jgi:uncharacterized alkaline shock family protein YloU
VTAPAGGAEAGATALADAEEAGRHAAAPPPDDAGELLPELPEPGERGRLTIAEKVVERVAGYAVTQVDGASAAPRRLLGMTVGDARPDAEASVTAQVDGHAATVEASVAITWPNPVRVVADRLRAAIRHDVALMTDVQVAQVDLDVVSFAAAATPARRVR